MKHKQGCVQWVDKAGVRWHSANCESPTANYTYAGDMCQAAVPYPVPYETRQKYAGEIIRWLFAK